MSLQPATQQLQALFTGGELRLCTREVTSKHLFSAFKKT